MLEQWSGEKAFGVCNAGTLQILVWCGMMTCVIYLVAVIVRRRPPIPVLPWCHVKFIGIMVRQERAQYRL